ncbi:amino acid adenylation domain-containing protein [Paenibacillus sp. PR3]|uniref:Amino acid adenylation domain-containing protein n=1 Tax=Paenibacillus terricola TaxID=2763503 RepID=A0ABR8MU22_9BACL|nr:non-ribosomal peptide synthetase [Paenibacillus terricola]MBD3919135.1 amino acid adenylation domain-containing protein [Paenibacillus terricola]
MLDFNVIKWGEQGVGESPPVEELSMHEIAIIGISAKLPLVDDLEQFWKYIQNGVDFISEFPEARRRDIEPYAKKRIRHSGEPEYFHGAFLEEIDTFDYAFFKLSPKEASLTTPNQRLFLETAWHAFEDAGYSRQQLAGSRTGVYVGYNSDSLYDYKSMVADTDPDLMSLAIPGNLSSIIAGRISYLLDLKGPSLCIDTACSSSLVSVHMACQALRNQECDMAIAGSVKVHLMPLANEVKIGIEASDWRARTFDDSSDGTGAGEGVIAFLLKPLGKALQDGDSIYAVIKGSAVNQDGSSIGMTAPNAASQEAVIVQAWENAGVDPESISYIEAHGTGTKLGDPIEVDGIQRAFRRFTDRKHFVAIGSTKTNLGHLDHAAGMAGMLKAVLAMKHKQIPPLLHFNRPNQTINFIESPVYVADSLMEWESEGQPRRCGVSAFGMSGTNCHIVLEEAPPVEEGKSFPGESDSFLLSLSAKSDSALRRLVMEYSKLTIQEDRLADMCFTASLKRDHYEHRLAIVFHNSQELIGKCEQLLRQGLASREEQGIFYGYQKPEGALSNGNEPAANSAPSLMELARLYAQGASIAWEQLYKGQKPRKMRLPAYPFEASRCWLDIDKAAANLYVLESSIRETAALAVEEVELAGRASGIYTAVEREIAQIWGETLGFRKLDVADNFHELGGDSILALKIVNRIRLELSVPLEVSDLFNYVTVADLAGFLEQNALQQNHRTDYYAALKPAAKREHYPLTSSQYRVFIQEQFGAQGTENNTPFCIMSDGMLNMERLEGVFRELIANHEALRTSFQFRDGQAVQLISDSVDFQIKRFQSSKNELDAVISSFVQPFDLATAPLLRVGIVMFSSGRHLIMIDMHHIISDGVSSSILIKQFCELYKGRAVEAAAVQFKDYAVWQQEALQAGLLDDHKRFWLEQLSGELPKLQMPTDFARPAQKGAAGQSLRYPVPAETRSMLESFAKTSGVTMNSLLFSLYTAFLHLNTGQNDMVVGTLVSGRNHPYLENVFGMFINFLPIRIRIQPAQTLTEHLLQVNRTIGEAYTHDYPFDQMISDLQLKTDRSRNPLYDTMLVYHNEFQMNPTAQLNMEEEGLTFSEYPLHNSASPLDFKLDVWSDLAGEMVWVMQYDTALYTEASMRLFLDRFLMLADYAGEHADVPFGQIHLRNEMEPAAQQDLPVDESEHAKQDDLIDLVVSATFTSEPIEETIRWWCGQFQLDTKVTFAPYHQVFQQLLDPASLFAANKGVNVLLVRFEDFLRDDISTEQVKKAKLESIYTDLVKSLEKPAGKAFYWVGVFPVATHLSLSSEMLNYVDALNQRWKQTLSGFEHIHLIDFGAAGSSLFPTEPQIFDAIKDQEGHLPFTDEFYAAMGTVIARNLVAWKKQKFKAIILDCDNTIWQGVSGETGPLGVGLEAPFRELQQFMLDRFNEGMLLALCSKNNEQDVWDVFEKNPRMILKREHFVSSRINWQAKSANLRQLADELNLGLDSFIFLDDSALECSEVLQHCPEVLALQLPGNPLQISAFLQHVWAFDKFSVTEEDRKRTSYYLAEAKRRSSQDIEYGTIDGFLQSLELRLTMRRLEPEQAARAAQLTQRTNQFNMSTVRRTEEEILMLLASDKTQCWGIEVEDRFGEYGFVGLVIGSMEQQTFVLDTFLLSCRVLGRQVELAILCVLKQFVKDCGGLALDAPYVKSKKNEPFKLFLDQSGWEAVGEENGSVRYRLPLERIADAMDHIQINTERVKRDEGMEPAAAIESLRHEKSLSVQGEDKTEIIPNHSLNQQWDWTVSGLEDSSLPHYAYLLPLKHCTANQLLQLSETDEGQIHRGEIVEEHASQWSKTERELFAIWIEILRMNLIELDDHFFDIGGNSLQAVSLASRIHQQFNVQLTLRELFTAPTIRQMARTIEPREQSVFTDIIPVPDRPDYPVTSAQKRLLVLQQLDERNNSYNQTCLFEVEGELDKKRLQGVCRELVNRHESLRTSFQWQDGEFVQKVIPSADFPLEEYEAGESGIGEVISQFIRPFDLKVAPLFRAGVIPVAEHRHLLMFDMHHAVADGVSISILMDEFLTLYQGDTLPKLRVQYRDFAVWQQTQLSRELMHSHERYWLQTFSDDIPVLNLPTDFPRPTVQTFEGGRVAFALDSGLQERVQQLASSTNSTPYMVYLAAYNILLSKYCGQEDIVVGSPSAGRPHADLEGMIGMFVNTLVLRNKPGGAKTFRQFLTEVKNNTLQALEHQDYPFEDLVEKLNVQRDLSRNPLFDTMFSYQNMSWSYKRITGLQIKPYAGEDHYSRFDITLELAELEGGLQLRMDYASKLFQHQTMQRFARHYVQILKAVTMSPEMLISQIDMMDKLEKAQLMFGFNETYAAYDSNRTIHQWLEERATGMPDQTAVVLGSEQMTYGELNGKANQLARTLRANGVQPDHPVAIMMERSFEMLIGIFGILKAGGAYVPIDPHFPEERIRYILDDTGTKLLLSQSYLMERLAFSGLWLDLKDPEVYHHDSSNLKPLAGPTHLAYVIYTSGSTGKPKGVMLEHTAVVNRIHWMQKQYPLGPQDVILQKTAFTFDVSVWELFWWSYAGSSVCLLQPREEKDPQKIVAAIAEHNVTTMHFVPSMLHLFLDYVERQSESDKAEGTSDGRLSDSLKSLRHVFASGEALPARQVERFYQFFYPDLAAKLINLYGPTEAAIDVTCFECQPSEVLETVPIGKPIDNIQLYIVDAFMKLQPVGVPGELCIAGVGLARGYMNRPDLTSEKFVDNPFQPGERMYRTGDLARWLPDGCIEYMGRLDHQVKLRGFRIELGEIETALLSCEDVAEAVVLVKGSAGEDQQLCAYLVTKHEVNVNDIRMHLKKKLPDYMIPSFYIQLDNMPLTSNGKVDRKALMQLKGHLQSSNDYMAPQNQLEAQLVEIWKRLLSLERVGVQDNFFEIGGHSLKAITLLAKVQQHFQVKLGLKEIFQAPTIEQLAIAIQNAAASAHEEIPKAESAASYPLSSAQMKLFVLQQLDLSDTTYHLPGAYIIEGDLDIPRLEWTFQALVQRHESLRTSFDMSAGEFIQIIHPEADFRLHTMDLTDDQWEEMIPSLLKPFDLRVPPLMRAVLIRLPERNVLYIDMHHIISDGVSLGIIVKDLLSLYAGRELSELRLQYKDYAVWQQKSLAQGALQQQEAYWQNRFSGTIPTLRLPLDFSRPAVQSFEGSRIRLTLDRQMTTSLNALAAANNATLYMVVLSAFHILLSKYSGSEDIVVGTPAAGRTHADLQGIVGMLVNTLAIRSQPESHMTFQDYLQEMKQITLDAFENQDYPFEQLVEKLQLPRDISRNPLYDAMFVLQNQDDAELNAGNMKVVPYEFFLPAAKVDISLEIMERQEQMNLALDYAVKLFRKETAEQMLTDYVRILTAVTMDPNTRIADIQLQGPYATRKPARIQDIEFNF